MLNITQKIKKNIGILIRLSPLLSFIIPLFLLYSLYPGSFEGATPPSWEGWWQGRFLYLFFIWLISLEIILDWENLKTSKVNKLKSIRTIALIITFLLPTIYVVAANYFEVNTKIVDLAKQHDVPQAHLVPLAVEYLVFAVLFGLMTFLVYGIKGIKDFSISTLFLMAIGILYMIDDMYPVGRFAPFQFFVQPTAGLAANVLNIMGYQTTMSFSEYIPSLGYIGYTPVLTAKDSLGRSSGDVYIAWPCAGVESLLIYTLTVLLFLKNAPFLWKRKKIYFTAGAVAIYFAVGAIVTYFINALRIATIVVILINRGDWEHFHNFYGPLYSIIWIVSYPLIIIGGHALWRKIRNWKTSKKDSVDFLNQFRIEG